VGAMGVEKRSVVVGVTKKGRRKPPISAKQRKAAVLAAAWMAEQRRKVNVLLGEVLQQIDLADDIGDSELSEAFLREQSFLRDHYEDLDMSRNAADLLSIRPTIEALT